MNNKTKCNTVINTNATRVASSTDGNIVAIATTESVNGKTDRAILTIRNIEDDLKAKILIPETTGLIDTIRVKVNSDGTRVAIAVGVALTTDSNSKLIVYTYSLQDYVWVSNLVDVYEPEIGTVSLHDLSIDDCGKTIIVGMTVHDKCGFVVYNIIDNNGNIEITTEAICTSRDLNAAVYVSLSNDGTVLTAVTSTRNEPVNVEVYSNTVGYWKPTRSEVYPMKENSILTSISTNADNTLLAIASSNMGDDGIVTILRDSPTGYTRVGEDLRYEGDLNDVWFGSSLELSTDGDTLVVGVVADSNAPVESYSGGYIIYNLEDDVKSHDERVQTLPNSPSGTSLCLSDAGVYIATTTCVVNGDRVGSTLILSPLVTLT